MRTFLLQSSLYGETSQHTIFNDPIITPIIIVIGFIIGVYVTRAVFSISTIVKQQKAQTILLMRIARNNGLTDEEFKNVKEIIEPDISKVSATLSIKQLTKEM
jgi:hypothetical protein